jgi:hypothetical protein
MPTAENLDRPLRLTKDHDRNTFDCGVPALNEYLKKYALQNQKKLPRGPMLPPAVIG